MDLTRLEQRLQPTPDGESPVRHRTGIVDAVNADGTVDLDLGGTVIPDVSVLDGALVEVGDVVQAVAWAGDLLVLGRGASALQGWQSFTPTLETTGTAPVLGTVGTIQLGRWCESGGLVQVQGLVRYGSTGETIGTGAYFFRFGGLANGPPLAATVIHSAASGLPLGLCKVTDNGSGANYFGDLMLDSNQRVAFIQRVYPAAYFTNTSPLVIQELDWFWVSFSYEPA